MTEKKSLYDVDADSAAVDALGESARAATASGPTDFGQEPPTVKSVKHYHIEPTHLVALRAVAGRLDEKGLSGDAQEIMEVVRYAEALDAFLNKPGSGEPYVHMTSKSSKEKP